MAAAALCGLFSTPLFGYEDLSFSSTSGLVRFEAETGTLSGATVVTDQANYTGTGAVFIDEVGESVSWTGYVMEPGLYRVTLGCKSPYGTEGQNKHASVSINGRQFDVELPNTPYFTSVYLGEVWMEDGNDIVISDNWTWFYIDWIQFVAIDTDANDNDRGYTRKQKLLTGLLANQAKGLTVPSGQQEEADAAYIIEKTGKAPAIICEDFVYYGSGSLDYGGNPGQLTENVIKHWEEGYIVTLCWHWISPSGIPNTTGKEWWRCFYSEHSEFDVAAAMADPTSSDYQLLVADIDRIAVELKKLADANVPVLWRPLHEAEGNPAAWGGAWFWWGDGGSEPFKQLWHLMYDRLENYHGLKNLIWVYTCTDQMQTSWYPGDEYVDIIGIDQYPSDRTSILQSTWDNLNTTFGSTGKPFALTEFGGVPNLEDMLSAGIKWLYFASWYGETNGPESVADADLVAAYTSRALISADELDQNLDGVTNGVCWNQDLPLQFTLQPALGLNTGESVEYLDLFEDPYEHDLSNGNLLEMDGGSVVVGAGFEFMESEDLVGWSNITPQFYQFGEDGRVLFVVPFNETEPRFYRLTIYQEPQ